MQDVSLFAPPAVAALAGRLVGAMPTRGFASPTVNLAITNVPGSRQQMYLAGRPLEANYPVLTINEHDAAAHRLQSSPARSASVRCRAATRSTTSPRSSSGLTSSSAMLDAAPQAHTAAQTSRSAAQEAT